MKRIGIITFYKSDNVGAVLQAFSLLESLSRKGFDCEIVQYSDKKKKDSKMRPIKKIFHNFWYEVIKRKLLKDRKWERTIDFISRFDKLSSYVFNSSQEINLAPPEYDIYVTGSDQVWNTKITGNDDTYFLSFAPDNKRKISYGASLGSTEIIKKNPDRFRYLLSRINEISVRETDAAEMIKQLISKDVECVLDPTLLLNRDDWKAIANYSHRRIDGKYILCYYMPGDPIVERGITHLAKQISKETGFPIYNIGLKDKYRLRLNSRDIFDAGPAEFVWLIDNAEFVITNSFHGTVFSINLQKQFYVPYNVNMDANKTRTSRIVSILELLLLRDRMVGFGGTNRAPLESISIKEIEYEESQKRLEELRSQSQAFIDRAMKD